METECDRTTRAFNTGLEEVGCCWHCLGAASAISDGEKNAPYLARESVGRFPY
jgi:hypothetical protein